MVQETQAQTASERAITDRSTGRQTDDTAIGQELTFEERVFRFEGAEIEHLRASRDLMDGRANYRIAGDVTTINEALTIFEDSARFHAASIDEQELVEALRGGSISEDVAELIRDRKAENRKLEALDQSADRILRNANQDQSIDREASPERPDRDRDGER